MELRVNTCYSRLLYIMCAGEMFSKAVGKMRILKGPYHQYEGVAGYIETEVEFTIQDLKTFTDLWESYNSLSSKRKVDLYGLAKGVGDCK